MPVYVQTVDPDGPAAAAGVKVSKSYLFYLSLAVVVLFVTMLILLLFIAKVRQYIHSVNGKNVLRWSHQQVAEEILNSPNLIELVVMNHFRGS